MDGRNILEHIMGLFVVLSALAFGIYAFSIVHIGSEGGAEYEARFGRVGGLREGGDVRMRGVKVGAVRSVSLDRDTYEAVVRFSVRRDLTLPKDSQIYVASEGLSGSKFLTIVRGNEDGVLRSGELVRRTHDFESIEDKVSKIIFLAAGSDE
ncbi:MAG: MCE family protein [Alphaproteobacteria bacterium GM7ARS4]|nr:MCE family protein [Alphaproteobacteria bacterium GM7ARS4]